MSRKGKPPFLPSPTYEVGYGKPPRGTRFQKGQSGNPKGRPKGAVSRRYDGGMERLFEALEREAGREVTIREGGGEVKMTMLDAVVRTAMVKAAQGSARHTEIIFKSTVAKEAHDRQQHERALESWIAYKASWEVELARRERLGITWLPDPVPHPDHVLIDFDDGSVTFVGPMTEQEKAELDAEIADAREHLEAWYADQEQRLAYLEAHCGELEAKGEDDPKLRTLLVELRQRIDAQYAKMRYDLGA